MPGTASPSCPRSTPTASTAKPIPPTSASPMPSAAPTTALITTARMTRHPDTRAGAPRTVGLAPCRSAPNVETSYPKCAEARIDDVAAHAIRRPDDIGVPQVRQRVGERGLQLGIGVRQRQPGRASLPHPHQPDRVHPGRDGRIPVGGRNAGQGDRPPGRPGQPVQPHCGVYLVDHRLARPPSHRVPPSAGPLPRS